MKILMITAALSALFWQANAEGLNIGDPLPADLSAVNQHGQAVSLSDFNGKWLILYFYPKDDTPGCTREAQTFSQLIEQFKAVNAVVLGVSTDSPKSHRKFIEKYDLKIDLLADADGKLAELFGVKVRFGFCSRDTMLINPDGAVAQIYRGVSPDGSPGEILTYLEQLKN